jgi:hypothetical protein
MVLYSTIPLFLSPRVYWSVMTEDEKIFSMPSIGSEVKPFAPCRRFAAYKRSLNGVEKGVISAKLSGTILAHISTIRY